MVFEYQDDESRCIDPGNRGTRYSAAFNHSKSTKSFYYDIRFAENDQGWTPIWSVDALPATKPNGHIVAWAVERQNGARGFATTCGHYYRNWEEPNFRKTVLNAILWTAHATIPNGGVATEFLSHAEIARHLNQPDALASSILTEDESSTTAYANEPYWYQPGHAVNPAKPSAIESLPGFQVEQIYSVPEASGSWTAITADGQGRLLCAAQHKSGIYRLTPSSASESSLATANVERLDGVANQVGWCHGTTLCF